VISGTIVATDPHTHLAAIRIGEGTLNVTLKNARPGAAVRIQVLARDVILAVYPPEGLSVRNVLAGRIVSIVDDDDDTDLVSVDVGGSVVLARVTRAAMQALSLRTGMLIHVLVKAVSIRGHAFMAPRARTTK
jgi:molybdate transport system ATP-binding protein